MKYHDNNHNEDPDFSFNREGKDPFGLPSDYFASFEEKLRKKIETDEELAAFPLLSSIPKDQVFGIPEHYFNSREQALQCQTELMAYPMLQSIAKAAVPELDEAYQTQLKESLAHKLELAEELRPYNALYALDKTNPYTVAGDYFELLDSRIKERVLVAPEEKTPVLDRLLAILFGSRTAWAFGFSLIALLAIVFRQKPEPGGFENGDCKTLACLEKYEILNNNKAITSLDEEQLIELVDVKTLGKQLNLDQQADSLLRSRKSQQEKETEELLDAL